MILLRLKKYSCTFNMCLLLITIFMLSSCTSGVIERDSRGYRQRRSQKVIFDGIKKKVALLSFFNDSPYGGNDLGIVVTEELRSELSRTGNFIIDPMSKKIFGSSKEVYSGGGVKLVQLAKKGKVSGVNLVVYGRIADARIREKVDEIGLVRKTKSYSEATVEVRIFDIGSNKEIYADTVKSYVDDKNYRFFTSSRSENLLYRRELLRYSAKVAVRKAIPRILRLTAKLDWVGRVAKIIGNRIYINSGRQSGMNIGDILKVITEGDEIYDPETGALIGMSKGEVKATIEIIDYFGPDGSVAVIHSGGAVREGDLVQLY